ncbi:glutamyl-tRNA(Gln) amidotransferase subunit C, mitochondrial [Musca vetustissima]|uniref:glutamyl-tRNA(Gln) amidotransferase subunit C, mitochondrial n=1 Tax=Musca vetustissima TaxID=27455 RepID=UPI002AB7DCF4|nr:glutamyl-tRNA(Gln) amidotransferase subunit C, mitochondrial [Musca vetustissima]
MNCNKILFQCYPTDIHAVNNVPVDSRTLNLLERLSLVNLEGHEAVEVLQKSINFAENIVKMNTECVEPLYRVLYEDPLRLRSDQVTEGNCRQSVLQNAKVTDEDYFIAPPGNIPLSQGNVRT